MQKLEGKILDHLGIVSVISDRIGIKEIIDHFIPPDPQMQITHGESVKLMILNGLGFTSRPLYLAAQFFQNRPTHRFLGRDDVPEINDDRLGRTLDKLFEYGSDRLFAQIASKAAMTFSVSQKFRHLDATSVSVHGEYETENDSPLITFGFSKGKRPDLKQFMIYLMCSQDGDVPFLSQALAGDDSEKEVFRRNLKALKDQIRKSSDRSYFVADSVLYTEDSIREISAYIPWITRVPATLKEAKQLSCYEGEMREIEPGYRIKEHESEYGGVKQRWLLVDSDSASSRAKKGVGRRVEKEFLDQRKALRIISKQKFHCEGDAKSELEKFSKKLKYHKMKDSKVIAKSCHTRRGRPSKQDQKKVHYCVSATLEKDEDRISKVIISKGRFIVATNELDRKLLSSAEMLSNYKEQQSVERGFRFLKDSSFMTSSVFLKKQERIVALAMIMCLCTRSNRDT